MSPEQTTLETATGADTPEIGVTLETQTHRAHVRYAASETPGVIWYDPRDGRERYVCDRTVTMADFESMDDRVLTSVVVRPHRPGEAVDGRYCVVRNRNGLETFTRSIDGERVPGLVGIGSYRTADVFDSLEAAQEYCREHVAGYADAPRKDAVAARGER
ncbi:hypothetical protein [Natrinema thermotolerans]